MNSQWKKIILFVVLLLVIGWLTVQKTLLVNQNPVIEESRQQNPLTQQQKLMIGNIPIMVEVRQTEAEQALGLSWRTSLGREDGMLFAYQTPQKVLFWMKGMQFPLDFIWIAHDTVVELTENIPNPTSDHPLIRTVVPAQAVDGVLEVNAGFVKEHNLSVGAAVTWAK